MATEKITCNIPSFQSTQVINNFNQDAYLFPKSTCNLWDCTNLGNPITFGLREYHNTQIICLERCLRLAHRHATQQSNKTFNGFLLGNTSINADERGIILNLDRFDPGTTRSNGTKTPSALLPDDVVVCLDITYSLSEASDEVKVYSVDNFKNAFKLLQNQVSGNLPIEATFTFPLRLHCYYGEVGGNNIEMNLHWVSLCITNSISAIPIKQIPILPTALAKNLCGPLNISQVQNSFKTGFVTMNQSRKLILMLDSDPKIRCLPTIGVWVSGVMSVHSPIVWRSCMRYLHASSISDRVFSSRGEFLLVLYSLSAPNPMFFQCKCSGNNELEFDLYVSQDSSRIFLQSTEDEKLQQFRLNAFKEVSCSLVRDLEAFYEAKEIMVENTLDSNKENNICTANTPLSDRGRQRLKQNIPQSILKSSSSDRSRSRSGVKFSTNIPSPVNTTMGEMSPKPLPSPHPSSIMTTPGSVCPSVPEVSILFDDEFSSPQQINYPRNSSENHEVSPVLPNGKQRNVNHKTALDSYKAHIGHQQMQTNQKSLKQLRKPSSESLLATRSVQKPNSTQLYQRNHMHISHQRSRSMPQKMPPPTFTQCLLQHPNYVPYHPSYAPYPQQNFNQGAMMLPPQHAVSMPVYTPAMYSQQPVYQPYPRKVKSQNIQTEQFVSTSPPETDKSQPVHLVHKSNINHKPNKEVTNPPEDFENQIKDDNVPEKDSGFLEDESKDTSTSDTTQNTDSIKPAENVEENQSLAKANDIKANIESKPAWVKDLPPEAYDLLMQQNAQLRQLQEQISRLLAMQEKKEERPTPVVAIDTSVSSINTTVSRDSGTDCQSIEIEMEQRKCKLEKLPAVPHDKASSECTSITSSEIDQKLSVVTPAQSCISSDIEGSKVATSTPAPIVPEFTNSQRTDSTNLNSVASLRLNASTLDKIATANSDIDDAKSYASSLQVDLPALDTSTEQSTCNTPARQPPVWNDDSPVLGESASMCQPNILKPPQNDQFFGNLLTQVRDMLKKADIDGADETLSHKSNKMPKKKKTCSVASATKRQLRKMGVNFYDNIQTNGVEYSYSIPKPLIPRIQYSVLEGKGPASTELSMHANAIAMKYIPDEKLTEIAKMSENKLTNSELFFDDKVNMSQVLPGMSLVSPCNMSLATRKYMEKYGLIEKVENSTSESEEDDVPIQIKTRLLSNNASKYHKQSFHADQQQSNNLEEEDGVFLDLDKNLGGHTVNMLQPFLDDLGRHKQQTPTSGRASSRSSQRTQSPRSQGGGSYVTVEQVLSPRVLQALAGDQSSSRPPSRQNKQRVSMRENDKTRNEFDVLSPRLMKVVQGGGQLKPIPTLKEVEEAERNSEHLGGTWPRDSLRNKLQSVNIQSQENVSKSESYEDDGNVLTSEVAAAFNRKNSQTNKRRTFQESIQEESDEDNFLDMDKINSLQPLK